METTLGPIHLKSSARKLGSEIPKSFAKIALARLNSASGSLVTGGGVEGGRGTTSVSVSKGFGI